MGGNGDGSNWYNLDINNKHFMSNIKGTWVAAEDDFIVNYSGNRRFGTIAYSNKIDKRGYVRANVWHDKDQDGKKDKGEKMIAKYKAEAEVVYYELNYYSRESGKISINEDSGKFKLYHDGDFFGKGKIVDMDYFFG